MLPLKLKVLTPKPKVLPSEPKVLPLEPKVLPFRAKSTAKEARTFWPEMLPESIQTFLEKMKPRGSHRI